MDAQQLIQLVGQAQEGDAVALQKLYLDSYKSVYYLALKILHNPGDAEDVTQDVFITVCQRIGDLKEPAAFYKWINQITARRCYNHIRDVRPLAGDERDEDAVMHMAEEDALALPDRALDDAETRQIILGVIDGLPVHQRFCVMAYYYEQLTIAQIAEITDTNENTVKSRLALARGKIRAALEEKERKEGIKLYGVPLALTPILRQAFTEFPIPQGLGESLWGRIASRLAAPVAGAPAESVRRAMKPGVKAALACVSGVAVLAVLSVLLLPRLLRPRTDSSSLPVSGTSPAISNQHVETTGPPSSVSGLTGKITQIAAGRNHSAAIDESGGLWMWGAASVTKSAVPVKVLDGVQSVVAGEAHTLALKTDGSVWGCGSSAFGILGPGYTGYVNEFVKIMEDVAAVDSGRLHAMAIKTDGTLWGWGYNQMGILGAGTEETPITEPVKILDSVAEVSAGDYANLARLTDGSVWAWGAGQSVPDGDPTGSKLPVQVFAPGEVKALAAGSGYSMVIKSDDSLWAWGNINDYGILNGNKPTGVAPIKLLDGVRAVAAGINHTMVIRTNGELWGWGADNWGQLGAKDATGKIMDGVIAVSVGGEHDSDQNGYSGANHTLAVAADGSLWAWGCNVSGQLGTGDSGDQKKEERPVKIAPITE